MIEISELTKYYGRRKAVGPLSFTIEQGEVVGLLGLNGAGKTTTLRMLSSDLLPTSGSMLVDGLDLADVPEKVRPRIGYLPDKPPLYGEMTVREYLKFAGKLRGMTGSLDKRVKEVIEITDLGDYADERIDTLSHGFRQRVGIAQAIVHRPALLLLDEPISGLDPVQIVEMRALVRSLAGEHTTVLSSHILSEISETCDRLLVIRDGEIVASGSEQELGAQMAAAKSFRITVRVPEWKAKTYRDAPGGERGTPFGALRDILEGIDGVQRVTEEPVPLGEQGVIAAGVAATLDVREIACQKLVEAELGILGLERTGKELERVFLQLTGKEAAS